MQIRSCLIFICFSFFKLASNGIKDPFIRKFRSFNELTKYARTAHDPNLLGKIKVEIKVATVQIEFKTAIVTLEFLYLMFK